MGSLNFTIFVKDASTHFALAGAQVFINGVGRGMTDSTGQLTVLVVGNATVQLSVKKDSYALFDTQIVLTQPFYTANLIFKSSATTKAFTLVLLPEDKASNISVTFSNGGSPVTQLYHVGGITVPGLTVGPQTVTATAPGFQPINQTFDLAVVTSGTIQMTVTSDSGFAKSQTTNPQQDPDVSSILPAITPEALPEFIAPNTGQGTYFTMSQARMYIGDLFINELNSLQFALQDNKIPVYGYASRYLEAKAQGKSLVQGQFSINFISEGYLLTALNRYKAQVLQGDLPDDPIKDKNQKRLLQLVNQLQNPDPIWTPDQIKAAKDEIRNLAASLGPDALISARSSINVDRKSQNDSILGLPGGDYSNPIYSDVEFDIVIQYTGAGRTIIRRLEQCSLISNESILDMSGTPILDSYGFIARRLR